MRERQEPRTQTMKAMEARQQWSKLLNKVFHRETRVVIERSGIPVAAVVSIEDLKRLQRLAAEREQAFKALDASWKAFEGIPLDDMEEQVAKAVTEARAELREEAKQHAAKR
jgi:prevent-host-death family protein